MGKQEQLTPLSIAIKYVHGLHDALTDDQEVKDMIADIETLISQRKESEKNEHTTTEIYNQKITKKMQDAESFIDQFITEKGQIPSYQGIGDYFNITKAAAYQRLRHCRNKLVNQPDRTITNNNKN